MLGSARQLSLAVMVWATFEAEGFWRRTRVSTIIVGGGDPDCGPAASLQFVHNLGLDVVRRTVAVCYVTSVGVPAWLIERCHRGECREG